MEWKLLVLTEVHSILRMILKNNAGLRSIYSLKNDETARPILPTHRSPHEAPLASVNAAQYKRIFTKNHSYIER